MTSRCGSTPGTSSAAFTRASTSATDDELMPFHCGPWLHATASALAGCSVRSNQQPAMATKPRAE